MQILLKLQKIEEKTLSNSLYKTSITLIHFNKEFYLNSHMQKNEIGAHLTLLTKLTWIKHINIRLNTAKPLEKKEEAPWHWSWQWFLDITPKGQATKVKVSKWATSN